MGRSWERWLVGGLILMAGGAGWFLWSGSHDPRSESARPPTTTTDPVAGSSSLTGAAQPGGEVRAEVREAVSADPAEAGAVEAATKPGLVVEQPLTTGFPLRVLRGRTDEPVPHAVVSFGEQKGVFDAAALDRQAYGSSMEERVGELRHFQADEQGQLLVPSPLRFSFAFCEHEGAWGWIQLWTGSTKEEIALRVFPDSPFTVRVVTGAERAPVAGAKVAIRYEPYPAESETLDTTETGEDGTVLFKGVSQYSEYYWAHTEELAAVLAGVFDEIPAVVFDPANPPETMELELPPCTELEVLVQDMNGAPVTVPFLVRVDQAGEAAFDDPGRSAAVVADGGRAVFSQIGVDLALEITGSSLEGHVIKDHTLVRSSAVPGGTASAVLVVGETGSVLTGRLLGQDGTPLANERIRAAVVAPATNARREVHFMTDADGGFRAPVRASIAKQPQINFEATTEADPSVPGDRLASSTTIPGPLGKGDHALGDLQLAGLAVLASGTVVDESGQPVASAGVAVSSRLLANNTSQRVATGHVDKQGKFVIYGYSASPTMSVSVSHPTYAGVAPLEVPVGSTGLEFVLSSAGRIEGGVLFEEEWFCDFALARCKPEGSDRYTANAYFDRPGFFRFNSLLPGEWTVLITMESEMDIGIEVHNVKVAAGEVTRDPRLQNIDLREKARLVTVEVVGAEGEELEDGIVTHREAGKVDWNESVWVENGTAHIFTLLDELDIYVTANQHRGTFEPRIESGHRVVMEPGVPARFHWTEPPPQVDNYFLRYDLLGDQPGLPRSETDMAISNEAGEGEVVRLPTAGRYELNFYCYKKSGNRWRVSEMASYPITIRESSEPVDYEVTLPDKVREAFVEED